MIQNIFIGLLEENGDVWRPAEAEHLRDDLFLILGSAPEGEVWEFQPGQVVRCRKKHFPDGSEGFVAYEPGPSSA